MIRKLMASSAIAALMTAGAISLAPAQTQPAQGQDPAAIQQPAAGADAGAAGTAAQETPAQPIAQSGPTLTPDQPSIATAFIGRDVYSSEGADSNNIGEVNDLIIGTDGQITHAVVGVGGFLGIGQKDVTVPFDQLEVVQVEGGDVRLIYAATREQLEAAEAFDRTAFDPEERAQQQEQQRAAAGADATAAGGTATGGAVAPAPGTTADQNAAATDANAPADQNMAAGGTTTTTAPADQQQAADANAPAGQNMAAGGTTTTAPADQQQAASGGATVIVVDPNTNAGTDPNAAANQNTAANTTTTTPVPADQQQAAASATTGQQTTAATTGANVVPSEGGFVNFSADQIRASDIIGQELYGAENESIGEVADLVLQPEGNTRAAIIDVGGFLGIGEKRVAIPFDQIQITQEEVAAAGTAAQAPAGQTGATTGQPATTGAADPNAQPQTAQTGQAAAPAVETGEPRLMVNMTREQLEQLPEWEDTTEQAAAGQTGATTGQTGAAGTADPNAPAGQNMAATTPNAPADPNAAAGQAGAGYTTATQDLSAEDLMGSTVYSQTDESLGDVGDVIFDQSGQIQAVVIDVGGFLGMGEKPVAVQFDALNVQRGTDGDVRLMVNATQEQLEAAPSYEETGETAGVAGGQVQTAPAPQ